MNQAAYQALDGLALQLSAGPLSLETQPGPAWPSAPAAPPVQADEARQALTYLDAFGYLAGWVTNWQGVTLADVAAAVALFQKLFHLLPTGKLDPPTVRAMQAPRCGCPDVVNAGSPYAKMIEFAAAQLPAWKKRDLRYAVAAYVGGIAPQDQLTILQAAFDAWSQYGNLNARLAAAGEAPDIVIGTGSGRQDNFDGPSGTLAWAYLPTGDDRQLVMKFDTAETWVASPQQRGVAFMNVACHEIGHLLGLDHSRVNGALMAPYYNQAIAVPQANDDIPRFQARYGAKTPPPPPTPPPPTPGAARRLVVDVPAGTAITVDGRPV